MKWNKSVIIVIVLALILVCGGILAGVVCTRQQVRIEALSQLQIASDSLISSLHNQNQIYNNCISEDSVKLVDNTKEINRLLMQRSILNSELLKIKKAVRELTSSESIDYFVKYTRAIGSRMYVIDSDTSLIVEDNGVRKADSIFVEHDFYKKLTPRLDSIITVQDSDIDIYAHTVLQYQLLVASKNQEITHNQETTNAVKADMQKTIDKVKTQRNVAGGGALVFLGLTILLII